MTSILDTIKKMLGIDATYDVFDTDIVVHINSAFATLHQLGVGPTTPFYIMDYNTNWSNFIEDKVGIESVKSYIYAKVKIAFDPPATSFAIDALKQIATEFEWRLNVKSEEPPIV